MTRQQIFEAIQDGKTVYWETGFYTVTARGREGDKDLFIKGSNGSMTYLEEGQEAKCYITDQPEFFYKDKSGRGFTANLSLQDILEMPDEENEEGEDEDTLHVWAQSAEIGDVFNVDPANEFIRIK